jgi:hypothetical protein
MDLKSAGTFCFLPDMLWLGEILHSERRNLKVLNALQRVIKVSVTIGDGRLNGMNQIDWKRALAHVIGK